MNGRKARLMRKVWYDLPKREIRRRRRLFTKHQLPHDERRGVFDILELVLSKMRKHHGGQPVKEATS